MATKKEKAHKHITLPLIASWFFGITGVLNAVIYLFIGYFGAAFFYLLAGLLVLPPAVSFLKRKGNITLSRWIKILGYLMLVFIAGFFVIISFINSVSVADSEATVQPTQRAEEGVEAPPVRIQEDIKPPASAQKVKSATLTIDRVQIQVGNLYPTRITVTNTGDVTIRPRFDYIVTDGFGNEVCLGSPLIDEFGSMSAGSQKTGELLSIGCMFTEDGEYTMQVDLLDSDYNKLDSASKKFTVNYWSQFDIDLDDFDLS